MIGHPLTSHLMNLLPLSLTLLEDKLRNAYGLLKRPPLTHLISSHSPYTFTCTSSILLALESIWKNNFFPWKVTLRRQDYKLELHTFNSLIMSHSPGLNVKSESHKLASPLAQFTRWAVYICFSSQLLWYQIHSVNSEYTWNSCRQHGYPFVDEMPAVHLSERERDLIFSSALETFFKMYD